MGHNRAAGCPDDQFHSRSLSQWPASGVHSLAMCVCRTNCLGQNEIAGHTRFLQNCSINASGNRNLFDACMQSGDRVQLMVLRLQLTRLLFHRFYGYPLKIFRILNHSSIKYNYTYIGIWSFQCNSKIVLLSFTFYKYCFKTLFHFILYCCFCLCCVLVNCIINTKILI